jgi:tetratricopeptide (TPR) repeat protein
MRRGVAWGTAQVFGLMLAFGLLGIAITGLVIEGALLGAGLFLVYRLGIVRMVLTRHHRVGIGLSRDGDLAGSLAAFQRSEAFWRQYAWLDRRRGWLMGASVPWPFAALAVYNQAYCHHKMGDDDAALAILDEALIRWPGLAPARELKGALLRQPKLPEADWSGLIEE